MELSDLLAGDHALRRERDLMCTGRAKLVGNLEAAADLEHRDDVADRNAISQPEPGRSNVHCALRVIDGIGLIRAPFGERSGQLYGILSAR